MNIEPPTTNSQELKAVFPIYRVDRDIILSQQGDVSLGFCLRMPEIFTMDARKYGQLHEVFCRIIRLLPKDHILHKQDVYLSKKFKADFLIEDADFLDRSSNAFFHERPYIDHSSYLYITRRSESHHFRDASFSSLLRSTFVPPSLLDGEHIAALEMLGGQIGQVLNEGGIQARRLLTQDFCGTDAPLFGQYLQLFGAQTGDIVFKPDWQVAGQYPVMMTISEADLLPQALPVTDNYEPYSLDHIKYPIGTAAPFGLLLPCNHIYNQVIIKSDKQETIKLLESKRLRLFSLSAYSRKNGLSAELIQEYIQESLKEGREPVRAHFNLICWTDDHRNLGRLIHKAGSAFTKAGILPKRETHAVPQLFWSCLPGNIADLPSNETFATFSEQASCLISYEGPYAQSISGLRLGDRVSGRPLFVDLSDEPMRRGWITNRNKFILGPSGSGKSFFTNHMLRSYHSQGSHVVIVDVGHSYRGLCSHVNGSYLSYEENSPITFNPFYTKEKQLDTEKRESLKSLLLALWKKDDETFTRSEYVAISNALKGYFEYLNADKSIFPCFDSFYDYLDLEFRDSMSKEKLDRRDFDLENFLYVLRPYYRGGEFDFLLNAMENLDLLEQRMVVFELDNIKDHPILFPVVTLIIMDLFISKMRKLKGIRKIILIEEAWKAIAREGMAEYIKYLFKTVRKFFGEAMVVTQEVEDIMSSPIVKEAIINNADCKILLDQSKFANRFEKIRELLALGEKEQQQVLSINRNNDPQLKYKEVFIGLGPVSKVYRCEVSPEEYLTYTTEQTEKELLAETTAGLGGNRTKALSQLARQMKQSIGDRPEG
jgi:conjugation system TraG family ATPase